MTIDHAGEARIPLHALPDIRGDILLHEMLAKHTSYCVGGPADIFAVPEDVEDLRKLLLWAKEARVPVFILGAGTNLLVSDKGIRGLVIKLGSSFSHVHIRDCTVVAGGAARLPSLVQDTVEAGLAGLEDLAGIPGSVGGAVMMNAGVRGREVKDALKSIRAVDRDANLCLCDADSLALGYRSSSVEERGLVVIEATFELRPGDRTELQDKVNCWLQRRRERHPVTARTAGSVFKNPSGAYAWEVLQSIEASGMAVGGARVSPMHANFIENAGGATASDIRELILHIQRLAKAKCGVDLQPEVKIVGEW